MIKFIVLCFLQLFLALTANAQQGIATNDGNSFTTIVNGKTVDIFKSSNGGKNPTILYIPGCNGLDNFGIKYQLYHASKFKEVWPEANFVVTQFVNHITQNQSNGRCDWDAKKTNETNSNSHQQARYVVGLAEWIKQQPWSSGDVHLFGFSWGGRVGLWLPSDKIGKQDVFKSVALIWPACGKDMQFDAGKLHTPVKIWSTEKDPLSVPTNCINFYSNTELFSIKLYPGDTHSWFTGPFFQPFYRWWPVQRVRVRHEFNEAWANETFMEWKSWALSLSAK